MVGNIVFQALNWWSGDVAYNDDNDDDDDEIERFVIKTWGVSLEGTTVSVTIKGFPPYYYVKIPYGANKNIETKFREWLLTKPSRKFRKSLLGVKLMKKKDFYGFKNNETWNFIRLSFHSLAAFRASIRIFQNPIKIPGIQQPEQTYKLYESNMEPVIRMMHHQNIEPCGWIMIPKGYWSPNRDVLTTRSNIDVECRWKHLYNHNNIIGERISPVKIASFDIECSSSHGDFPLAQKSYQKVSNEIFAYYHQHISDLDLKESLFKEISLIFQPDIEGKLSKVFVKKPVNFESIQQILTKSMDDIFNMIQGRIQYKQDPNIMENTKKNSKILDLLTTKLGSYNDDGEWIGIFPPLFGDAITQIGITCHKYGERNVSEKYVISAGPCDQIDNVIVIVSEDEKKLLLDFVDLLTRLDPDIVTGFNILGFDLMYMYGRSRELGITNKFLQIGRIVGRESPYVIKNLSSSALGENVLKYIDMEGRTIIDVMKVVQRDHKLDNYKLDFVANHFMNLNKKDVTPGQIFSLFKGSSSDRKILAEYCVQDCALCNQLIIKLEILANNIGMANVCNVPLSYIFLRGQGIKIFSLVAKQCREDDFVVPSLARPWGAPLDEEDDGYEGAIVLEPETGIYVDDPISVLDFASLYPSSMISENLSHDCHVLDEDNGKYDNIPGVEYIDITYDVFQSKKSKKSQNEKKIKIGEETRRFAQTTPGVLPRILQKLLGQRKLTRKKINYRTITLNDGTQSSGLAKYNTDTIDMVDVGVNTSWQIIKSQVVSDIETYDEFQKAVLDGLQLAYKVTANSLYGQTGSRVSPIYMKEVAACTTATGRNMILMAKNHVEEVYGAHVIYGDSVTGDTPLLIKYPDNTIDIKTIDNLTHDWTSYNNFKPFDIGLHDKQQGFIDAQVWTDGEWADIRRVIRHKTNKKIYRVNTFAGCVDVTEDHSLIDVNGNKIKPGDCVVGDTELRHSFPEEFDYKVVQIADQGEVYESFVGIYKECNKCGVVQDESEYYWASKVNKKTGMKKRVNRCRTCIKSVNAKRTGAASGPMINKILKYYVPSYEINKFEAWVWGIFFGDGSCGYYHCDSGDKRNWAINNSNMHYLEIAKKYLENIEPRSVVSNWKILDTLDSSKVYKLVPIGSIKYMVEKYRYYLYDHEDYKRIPDVILNANYETRLWFMRGYLAADGEKGIQPELKDDQQESRLRTTGIMNGKWSFACKGKIGAQGLYYLCISLGWKDIRINNRDDKINTYQISNIVQDHFIKKSKHKIMKIIKLEGENKLVYDIETSCGRFNAGIGSLNISNTDSIFVKFDTRDEKGNKLKGRDALNQCRELGIKASETIKPLLKKPHDLEWEKMFWPFILLSKKRYCANKYEFDNDKFKMNSMGIVLKRRDNANIVKIVYGEILNIILNRQDVTASIKFLKKALNDIILAKFPMEEFIISKTLKSTYSDPDRIAHKVLSDRMKSRDPGNAPQVNDRLPYAYIAVPDSVKKNGLQGDRIEHPDYIREKKLQIDFQHYLENQIMNPVLQIYALILETLQGYKFKSDHWKKLENHLYDKKRGELEEQGKLVGISRDEAKKIVMEKVRKKIASIREQEVKKLIFDPILYRLQNKKNKMTEITDFFS